MAGSVRPDTDWSGGLVDVLRRAPRARFTSLACLASLVIFIGLQRGPTDSWERLAPFGAERNSALEGSRAFLQGFPRC